MQNHICTLNRFPHLTSHTTTTLLHACKYASPAGRRSCWTHHGGTKGAGNLADQATKIYKHIQTYTHKSSKNAQLSSQICKHNKHIHKYTNYYNNIQNYTNIYQNVHKCEKNIRTCTKIYNTNIQQDSKMHNHIPKRTKIKMQKKGNISDNLILFKRF